VITEPLRIDSKKELLIKEELPDKQPVKLKCLPVFFKDLVSLFVVTDAMSGLVEKMVPNEKQRQI